MFDFIIIRNMGSVPLTVEILGASNSGYRYGIDKEKGACEIPRGKQEVKTHSGNVHPSALTWTSLHSPCQPHPFPSSDKLLH
jgi:hypothetical protein